MPWHLDGVEVKLGRITYIENRASFILVLLVSVEKTPSLLLLYNCFVEESHELKCRQESLKLGSKRCKSRGKVKVGCYVGFFLKLLEL